MQIIHDLHEWRECRQQLGAASVGFVPTMGALHAGHASLLQRSRQENQHTVLSIFVNPTQFDEAGDLQSYSRTLQKDAALAESLAVDYVFAPSAEAMYPDAFRYRVSENELATQMEGVARPGHFDGMLTVVLKLLNLVKPQRAYFGEKDYQQYLLVRDMAAALFLDCEIIPCTTVRELSGLAMSSRNTRLQAEQRDVAAQLYSVLQQAQSALQAETVLAGLGFAVEYVTDFQARRFAAVRLGDVRLIDNIAIGD